MHVARSVVSVGLGALLACGPDAEGPTSIRLTPSPNATALDGRTQLAWSDPVWLGPVVNSSARDLNPELSHDGLSLYFTSFRDGAAHIYVSQRPMEQCTWGAPVKLPSPINADAFQFSPDVSPDGHYLYFASTGHGGFGGTDIFMSYREDPTDDFGWGPPTNLGPPVNTTENEHGPLFVQIGGGELYFNRVLAPTQIFVAPMTRDGEFLGDAVPVVELNHPTAVSAEVAVRADGRELLFWSGGPAALRPGTVGSSDIFVSTRASVNSPWSEPVGLGTPINHAGADLVPTLSTDGLTMIYSTQRPGGLGLPDLWMSVRSRGGTNVPDLGVACPTP